MLLRQELRDTTARLQKREKPKLFTSAVADYIAKKKRKWSARTIGGAQDSLKHLTPVFGKRLLVL
jgi:hypothetical protein